MTDSGSGEGFQPPAGFPPPPPGWQPPPYQGPPPMPGQQPYGQQPYGQQPSYGAQPPHGAQNPYPTLPPAYGYRFGAAPVPGGRLAGMGARFGGLLLDGLVIGVPFVIIAAIGGAFDTHESCNLNTGTCSQQLSLGTSLTFDAIGFVIAILYHALMVGTTGQTLGHRAAGIRVVDVNTGGLISIGAAALRWFVLGITGGICTLGYWSPFFDSERRQGWHDKAAGSVVIPAR